MAEGYLQVKRVICVRGQVLNRPLVHLETVCVVVSGSAALRFVCASQSAALQHYLCGEGSREPS